MGVETVQAIKEDYYKSKKTKPNLNSPLRKGQFKGSINMLRGAINSINSVEQGKSAEISGKVKRILVDYEDLLQEADYALLAYGYLKTAEYMKAIEFAEEHLGLQEPTIQGVQSRINEVLEKAKEEQEKAKEEANKSAKAIGED